MNGRLGIICDDWMNEESDISRLFLLLYLNFIVFLIITVFLSNFKELEEDYISILEELKCSICHELPIEPVHGSDGKLYEKSYIEQWIKTKKDEGNAITSPVTREILDETVLLPAPHIYNFIKGVIDVHHPIIGNNDLVQTWLERVRKREHEKKQLADTLGGSGSDERNHGIWSSLDPRLKNHVSQRSPATAARSDIYNMKM